MPPTVVQPFNAHRACRPSEGPAGSPASIAR
jgi:hypothetical protein